MDIAASTSPVGMVERMLDHAAHQRWDELPAVLTDDFEIVEPPSLPYGGSHHGVDGYVVLLRRIGELFELGFEPDGVRAVDDRTVLLRMDVTFRARGTGRAVRMPVVEVLTVRAGRVARSEVFLHDTAALLATLG
jgi:ketosteroid isomerase-like protein